MTPILYFPIEQRLGGGCWDLPSSLTRPAAGGYSNNDLFCIPVLSLCLPPAVSPHSPISSAFSAVHFGDYNALWGLGPGVPNTPWAMSLCAESPDEVTGSQASSQFMGHREEHLGVWPHCCGFRWRVLTASLHSQQERRLRRVTGEDSDLRLGRPKLSHTCVHRPGPLASPALRPSLQPWC